MKLSVEWILANAEPDEYTPDAFKALIARALAERTTQIEKEQA